MTKNIFDYVKSEETSYKTTPVDVADGYQWQMYEHIRHCILIKDGKLLSGADPDMTPVKNIVLPILNVNYRSEGFDVKNIEPYANDEKDYYKSFLVRKYHDLWARQNNIDTLIDDVVESYVDFGGALVKRISGGAILIPLQTLAFCDQTDVLTGAFGIKHNYSVDQLLERKGVWNKESIDKVIDDARSEKTNTQSNGTTSKTPSKYIEVYEVHGVFPKSWLTSDTKDYVASDEEEYTRQIHFICYNVQSEGVNKGITLFRGTEKEGEFKMLRRDKRYGTALGRSAIEEMFEDQVWVNYSLIQKKAMLDKLAMILGLTDDPTFAQKNKITDMENGEWIVKSPNTTVEPFQFNGNNLAAFDNFANEMEQHARTTGSASDPQLGLNPSSGTPLGTTQIVTNQGQGIHQYRQGKVAVFFEELYRDWFLDDLKDDMSNGKKFLAELSLDELQEVADRVVTNSVNEMIKEKLLQGKFVSPEERDAVTAVAKENFMRSGMKRFIEILKGEIDSIPLDVLMNIAGKQKDQVAMVEKLSNFLRGVLTLPFVQADPANATKVVNTMLEASGLSPINFTFNKPVQGGQQSNPQGPVKSPMQPTAAVVQ